MMRQIKTTKYGPLSGSAGLSYFGFTEAIHQSNCTIYDSPHSLEGIQIKNDDTTKNKGYPFEGFFFFVCVPLYYFIHSKWKLFNKNRKKETRAIGS